MPCPRCQHRDPPSARFCSNCGTKLEVVCPRCARVQAPGGRFCTECGEVLPPAGIEAAPPASYTPAHLTARILASRGALEGERKQVSVLFADLRGSMELLSDRDPEEARALLDPVLTALMEAVHHYEGTVNQVMGDGIMALFGAPLAHEDHALRACYAALRMQERIGRYGDQAQRSHGIPVQIRVGLNSGEVVVRAIGSDLRLDYTAVGQTTHLAARMEQMAKPGSILLTPATLQLVEGRIQVRTLGPVAVKGLPETMEVFELVGAAPGRTRLEAAALRGLTRFVGRERELSHLHVALERARAGHGQIVALVGEPGVGKSRLVWELSRSHRTAGWLTLEASAVSYGTQTPFLPAVGLLRAYFEIDDRDDSRRIRERVTGRVLTLHESLRPALPALQALLDVPVEDEAWRRLGGDQRRRRTLDAVKRLLLRESQARPVLAVLEDLHWIDADTQALLDHLVDGLPSHRVLLLVNHRPGFGHGWSGKSYYEQIRLDPFPAETAETLLAALLGGDPGLAPLTTLLIERAQGNPFFLEESVRALAEVGVLGGEKGAYHLARPVHALQVPATVQAVLAARIDRLAPEDKRLVQVAAVLGTEVPLTLLRALADRPEEDLAQGLTRLQAAEFLYETRFFPEVEYTFRHALTHEVAYEGLLHGERRQLHGTIVDAIERLYPDRLAEHRDRLVHHAFRGERWSQALHYLRDLGAAVSAAEIDEVMGKGPESPGQLWWTGQHERAARAAERDLAVSASFGNFGMRVVSSCRLAQAHHALGNYARAVDLLRQIVGSLHGDLARQRFGMAALPAVFARSYLAWGLAERGEFVEGAAAGEEAVEMAAQAAHPYSQGHIAFGLGTLFAIQGAPDRAIPLLERALVIARMASMPFLVSFLTGPLGSAYLLAGNTERAVPLLEQAVEQGASMKLRAHHALRLMWLARARLVEDRPDLAFDLARRAHEVAEAGKERGQTAYARAVLAEVAAAGRAPDLPAAAAGFREAMGLAHTLGMAPLVAKCRLGLAKVDHRAGRPEAAREHLAAAAAAFSTMGMTVWLARAEAELATAG